MDKWQMRYRDAAAGPEAACGGACGECDACLDRDCRAVDAESACGECDACVTRQERRAAPPLEHGYRGPRRSRKPAPDLG